MEEEEDPDEILKRQKAKLNKAKKAKKKRAKAKKEGITGTDSLPKRTQTIDKESVKLPPKKTEEEDLDFEDPYGDEFEEEEVVNNNEEDEEEGGEDNSKMDAEENAAGKDKTLYYAPSKEGGEELEVDITAYGALHQMTFDWPALSFDFFRDHMGQDRTRLPTSLWFCAGTQTDNGQGNELLFVKVSNLSRTKDEADEGMVVVDDAEEEEDATIEERRLEHSDGAINRVRAMPQEPGIVATWSESGKVHLYDGRKNLQTLGMEASVFSSGGVSSQRTTPIFTFSKHKEEGFAMDWSPCRVGRLATGDCGKEIYTWDISSGGSGVSVESQPFKGHQGSIEDLQWSPSEENVFASCSTDGSVKIWDVRSKKKFMLSQAAHEMDVNVISWNRKVSYLLASGSDDCSFKVWDLRQFSSSKAEPVGWFKGFHTEPITSIEWSPHDESVIACTSADHQSTVWDLALEEDREFARQADAEQGLSEDVLDANGNPIQFPPQLLFIHAGVKDPKEIHFHPQIVGLIGVTGESGFDLFLCEPLDPKAQTLNM